MNLVNTLANVVFPEFLHVPFPSALCREDEINLTLHTVQERDKYLTNYYQIHKRNQLLYNSVEAIFFIFSLVFPYTVVSRSFRTEPSLIGRVVLLVSSLTFPIGIRYLIRIALNAKGPFRLIPEIASALLKGDQESTLSLIKQGAFLSEFTASYILGKAASLEYRTTIEYLLLIGVTNYNIEEVFSSISSDDIAKLFEQHLKGKNVDIGSLVGKQIDKCFFILDRLGEALTHNVPQALSIPIVLEKKTKTILFLLNVNKSPAKLNEKTAKLDRLTNLINNRTKEPLFQSIEGQKYFENILQNLSTIKETINSTSLA